MKRTESAVVLPRALKSGSIVGIVAPASPPFEEGDLEYCFQWLKKLGLRWKVGKHITDRLGDLAGTDADRLKDFHEMWEDPSVDMILPVRGGNGAVRLLDKLDFDLIAKNPKILMGYSDITGLLIPIQQETGLVTFHGPTALSFFESPYTYYYFEKSLMQTKPLGLISDPTPKDVWNPEYPPPRLVISPGKARGQLTGGCLSLIRQLMGTPWEIDTRGKILFVEDFEEEPHSLDRMLTQLELAGKIDEAAGIIIGECASCRPGDSRRNRIGLNYSVERMLKEKFGDLGKPMVYGMRLGHSREKFVLPLGVVAHLKADERGVSLKIEEPATQA
ncbi:MAG: LD-carboxypeptidase [Candidatus Melainabacteria bacterium]|nr:LD-carboxypeptidase [Candidatus Melainabacteria bacterium]